MFVFSGELDCFSIPFVINTLIEIVVLIFNFCFVCFLNSKMPKYDFFFVFSCKVPVI